MAAPATSRPSQCAPQLHKLREQLSIRGLGALLVSHDDEYLCEDLPPDRERLAFISGFTGSAGYAVITASTWQPPEGFNPGGAAPLPAALFVDGRYVLQAAAETDHTLYDIFDFADLNPAAWLCRALPRGTKVGTDLRCLSAASCERLRQQLSAQDLELVDTGAQISGSSAAPANLVDLVWGEAQPPREFRKVWIFSDEYNGCPSSQKRSELARKLSARGLNATVIGDPVTVCWLLNVRGNDRSYQPVVNSRLIAYSHEVLHWFINPGHLDDALLPQLERHFGHVDIFPATSFHDALLRLGDSQAAVYLDPDLVNAYTAATLKEAGAQLTFGTGLCQLPKACKNNREILGMLAAHLTDGLAVCRFLRWLDELTQAGTPQDPESYLERVGVHTEETLSAYLNQLREPRPEEAVSAGVYGEGGQSDFLGNSFAPISALGPNAALCHYNSRLNPNPRALGSDSLYLFDTGAHYRQGTTDLTRTVLVGIQAGPEITENYTLVLKAHIDFASLVFPPGTTGGQLDAIARRPLWDRGLDYAHGTGHGVGHVLAVHEGPQRVSTRNSDVPLEEGMVISDEPGYYKEGAYGIRLENLLVVRASGQPQLRHMLHFEPLSMVPFDRRLIRTDMLTEAELTWLNAYHAQVFQAISTAGGLTEDDPLLTWLREATAPLKAPA